MHPGLWYLKVQGIHPPKIQEYSSSNHEFSGDTLEFWRPKTFWCEMCLAFLVGWSRDLLTYCMFNVELESTVSWFICSRYFKLWHILKSLKQVNALSVILCFFHLVLIAAVSGFFGPQKPEENFDTRVECSALEQLGIRVKAVSWQSKSIVSKHSRTQWYSVFFFEDLEGVDLIFGLPWANIRAMTTFGSWSNVWQGPNGYQTAWRDHRRTSGLNRTR